MCYKYFITFVYIFRIVKDFINIIVIARYRDNASEVRIISRISIDKKLQIYMHTWTLNYSHFDFSISFHRLSIKLESLNEPYFNTCNRLINRLAWKFWIFKTEYLACNNLTHHFVPHKKYERINLRIATKLANYCAHRLPIYLFPIISLRRRFLCSARNYLAARWPTKAL